MDTPSIEALLARRVAETGPHPIALWFRDVPILGAFARAWVRAARSEGPKAQWFDLPPVVA